ncbi:MAG: hypothetical protein ACP5JJ_11230 [Anaerolineae bacterium]
MTAEHQRLADSEARRAGWTALVANLMLRDEGEGCACCIQGGREAANER